MSIILEIRGDHIQLDQLLKTTGLCHSGGFAHAEIGAGRVRVDGVVERVEIAKTLLSPDPRNPVDGWEPRVTSRYTVAGRLYRSNRVNYVSLNVQERGVGTVPYAQANIRGYRPGGKVRVFYRRERPDQSALKTPFPELLALFSLFPLALLVMGGVALFKGRR